METETVKEISEMAEIALKQGCNSLMKDLINNRYDTFEELRGDCVAKIYETGAWYHEDTDEGRQRYITGLVRHLLLDRLKTKKRRQQVAGDVSDVNSRGLITPILPEQNHFDPEEILISKETLVEIYKIFTEDEISVLLGDKTTKNVAKENNTSEAWVIKEINKKRAIIKNNSATF